MKAVGVWRVTRDGSTRVEPTSVNLERELEDWIERDSSLLETGLEIVGRQVHVDAGIIDLLALDQVGRWVVIEIKKGTLHRETIAQALGYAACVAQMGCEELWGKVNCYLKSTARDGKKSVETIKTLAQAEPVDKRDRDVVVYVVGTGQDPSLEQVFRFLRKNSQRVFNAVMFNVFELGRGRRILVRELTSNDIAPPPPLLPPARPHVREVLKVAERNGLGEAFRVLVAAANRHNFYPKSFKHSIMFAPANNKNRCLFVVRVKPPAPHVLEYYVAPDAFHEFYGLKKRRVVEELGDAGYRRMAVSQVPVFVKSLDRLMTSVGR